MSRVLFVGLLVALAAAPAFAQSAQPAGGGPPIGGPLVPGVCLLSQQAVFANAKMGVAASERLKALTQQVQAGIDAKRAPIENDAKALESEKAHLSPAEFAQRQQALTARVQALQADAQTGSRQVERTRQVVLARISREAQPVVASAYAAHKCGLLLDRNSVLGGNMGGDLTADVVNGLDAHITTITFDLEPATPAAATR